MNLSTLLRPLALAAPLLTLLPAAADAQQAYISAPAELYAGPGSRYPALLELVPGTQVWVEGCLPDYWWCDVRLPGDWRGWVFGGALSYSWMGEALPITQYGPSFGVPLISFFIGDYWGHHYRDRPWYNDRRYWRLPPPQAHGGPPPGGWRPPYQREERERGWEQRGRGWEEREERERAFRQQAERNAPPREERQRPYPFREERPAQAVPPAPQAIPREPGFPHRPEHDQRGDMQPYPRHHDAERAEQRPPQPAPFVPPPPRAPEAPPQPNRPSPQPHFERPPQAAPQPPHAAPAAPPHPPEGPHPPHPPEGPHPPHREEH